jgi:predicted small lipoprotein YifL
MKHSLLLAVVLFVSVLGVAGCGSRSAIEIPDEPVPMPKEGPSAAGAKLPAPEEPKPPAEKPAN